MHNYILFLTCWLVGIFTTPALAVEFHYFRNVPLDAKASTVHAFAQDSLGLLWLGSNNGLYHYDGYTLHAAPGGKSEYQTYIYSIAVLDGSRLALGTERGVSLYNYKKDCYEDLPMVDVSDVRTLLLVGDTLWIGSLKGLYTYDIKRKTFSSFTEKSKSELTSQIYALAQRGDKILVGTYNGLFEVTPETASVRQLLLPEYRKGANQFINAILVFDPEHTYIGTEYGLYRYADDNITLLKTPHLQKLPVKSMAKRDAETLLIGTDDGLFVYGPQQQTLQHIKHDARNPFSLANNIIWSVFTSQTGDVWVGTDLGFSGWTERWRERKFPIYQFTRSSDGNKFYQIWRDRSGWYWLGGDNGLIRTATFDESESESYWYRMDAAKYMLPHNRVRDIYEDREGMLWVASDGGVTDEGMVSTDFPMIRLADVYLMYAESVVRGGGGDLQQALNLVNHIRHRAFGNDDGNISTAQLTLDFILEERGRELFWEATRRTDLIRFGRFTGGSYLWQWKGGVVDGRTTDAKFNLYPIPVTDMAANPNLIQNTGY